MVKITKLATRARVKDRIGTSETSEDDRFDELLEVSTQVAVDLIGAEVRREADVTLYPDGSPDQGKTLVLDRFPIESITSIKQAHIETAASGFASITALTADEDYIVVAPGSGEDSNRGMVRRISGVWTLKPMHLQVVGTFGFADPADVPVGGIEPPERLQEAITDDTIARWHHRNSGGYGSSELPGSTDDLKPHPALVAACKSLRRSLLG